MEKEHFSSISAFNNFSLCCKFGEAIMRSFKELNFNVEKQKAKINFRFLFEAINGDDERVHMLCF